MNTTNRSAIEGVEKAFSCWLYDHPVSFPPIVSEAIAVAFAKWLDEHFTEIIEAIAKKSVGS
jgi:hypothetical protein